MRTSSLSGSRVSLVVNGIDVLPGPQGPRAFAGGHRSAQPQRAGQLPQPSPIATWLLLTGVVLIPSGNGLKFTPGRFVLLLLANIRLAPSLRSAPARNWAQRWQVMGSGMLACHDE